MKRVLVTGGCGFIGSNFVRYLLARYPGCNVTNLDKLTYAGNPENLADVEENPRYRFVRGDVCDPQVVDPLVEEADAVVHFAAESHVDRSLLGGAEFVHTNVYGTAVLLEAARRCGVGRFHQVSTDEVYGSVEEGAWTEESPVDPRNPYSASKASADILVRAYHLNHGLPAVITRASNNIGPCQYPEKRVPLYITNAIDDRPLPVYGDGSQVRDHLHVEDHCEAIDLVLREGQAGEVYNVGGENESNGIEIAHAILGQPRQAGIADRVRQGPQRARPPLRPRLLQDRRPWLEAAPRPRDLHERNRRLVRPQRGLVAPDQVRGRVPGLLREAVCEPLKPGRCTRTAPTRRGAGTLPPGRGLQTEFRILSRRRGAPETRHRPAP